MVCRIYVKGFVPKLSVELVIIRLVVNIAGDVKFIFIAIVFSALVVVCGCGYHLLPKKGKKD